MRIVVSYFYTYKVRLGSERFSKKTNREWTRNPTLLDIVVRYIRSLYRQRYIFFLGNSNIYLLFTITNPIL